MASMSPHLAEVANLVGDLARANILLALMGNRVLTAKELAYAARVSSQTTSSHLGRMTDAKLLQVCKQGRNRYYRLASPLVAQMVEAIMVVAADRLPRRRPLSKPADELRAARSCYDHLAGRLGVALADAQGARLYYSRGRRSAAHATRNGFLGQTWAKNGCASEGEAGVLQALFGLERASLSRGWPSGRASSRILLGPSMA